MAPEPVRSGAYVMTPAEIALGYVPGMVKERRHGGRKNESSRTALERVILEALQRAPCGVAFSGGRDSSLILAIACHVARREALPEPIPITKVFPEAPSAAEDEWQELVVRHLGIDHWERIQLRDELDLVGPVASRHLEEHGVVWPPTIHVDVPLLERLRGGVLLDGEGGDEVLGVEQHRIQPLTHLVRMPHPITWSRVALAAESLMPASLRQRRAVERWFAEESPSWLRPAGQALAIDALRSMERASALSFARSVQAVPYRRSFQLLAQNRRVLASPYAVELVSPLLHLDVVDALGRDGGRLGVGGRGWVVQALAGDLLPATLADRVSKADFGGVFWTRHASRFGHEWDGDGIDHDLVDATLLRDMWRSGKSNALTAALIQQAWLHTRHASVPDSGWTAND